MSGIFINLVYKYKNPPFGVFIATESGHGNYLYGSYIILVQTTQIFWNEGRLTNDPL